MLSPSTLWNAFELCGEAAEEAWGMAKESKIGDSKLWGRKAPEGGTAGSGTAAGDAAAPCCP